MPASGYEKFQEHYEQAASAEYAAFCAMPIGLLLQRVRSGDFGHYYQLWRAISSKALLDEAGWSLFDVLNSSVDYLVRYHCADALIKVAGKALAEWKPEMLSADKKYPVRQNLKMVEESLGALLGKRA
jgi:hypothetical protein